MGKLIIMRHAESVFGKQKRYSGIMDIPLSIKGIKQAIYSASSIPGIQYDIVYTSPLIRSVETALLYLAFRPDSKTPVRVKNSEAEEYILKGGFLPIVERSELQEREYGYFEGRTKKELELHYDKETIFKWRRSINEAPPGGETLLEIIEKVMPFYKTELSEKLEKGYNIFLVAHQSSIRALYYLLFKPTEKEIENIDFENSDLIYINYEKDNIKLIGSYSIPQNIKILNFEDINTGIEKVNKVAVYIFAGGAGTRMKELTKDYPKPLIIINGKPLIGYIISFLEEQKLIRRIYVVYNYLREKWKPFIKNVANEKVSFIYDPNTFSLINNLFMVAKTTREKYLVIISGDMIFNYEIINETIKTHIDSGNDVTVALNKTSENSYKSWDYIMSGNVIIDIIPSPNITNTERYFFIINRKTIADYTKKYSINLGVAYDEFINYKEYKKGWTCLIKKLIDCKKYVIKAVFLQENVINVNNTLDLKNAEAYLIGQDSLLD